MALSELEHPLAGELAKIVEAAEKGLGTSGLLPPHAAVDYVSPLDHANGVALLTVVNTLTTNLSIIHIPVFASPSSQYTIMNQDGTCMTEARIFIRDIVGEEFAIPQGDEIVTSRTLQFDVYDEGVIFSALTAKRRLHEYGEYESDEYDSWTQVMRDQSGLSDVYGAALMFLDLAA